MALVRYYATLESERGDAAASAAVELLSMIESEDFGDGVPPLQALLWCRESPRMRALAERHGIEIQPPEVTEPFPDYDLPAIWSNVPSNGRVALHDATQRAPCMLVILLGSYRANGPYLVLMRQWLRWWRAYSGDGLRECHVITAHPDADPGGASVVADAAAEGDPMASSRYATWLRSEEAAREAGAPVAVLYDRGGTLHAAADEVLGGVATSPYAVMLSGRRILLAQETAEPSDVSVLRAIRAGRGDDENALM